MSYIRHDSYDKAKIYAVTSGEYSDFRVNALFSTAELAEEYIEKEKAHERNTRQSYDESWGVEVYILDEREDWAECTVFCVELDAPSGDELRRWQFSDVTASHSRAHEQWNQGVIFPPVRPTGMVRSASCVSYDHAIKLAAEARQAWLREGEPIFEEGGQRDEQD